MPQLILDDPNAGLLDQDPMAPGWAPPGPGLAPGPEDKENALWHAHEACQVLVAQDMATAHECIGQQVNDTRLFLARLEDQFEDNLSGQQGLDLDMQVFKSLQDHAGPSFSIAGCSCSVAICLP